MDLVKKTRVAARLVKKGGPARARAAAAAAKSPVRARKSGTKMWDEPFDKSAGIERLLASAQSVVGATAKDLSDPKATVELIGAAIDKANRRELSKGGRLSVKLALAWAAMIEKAFGYELVTVSTKDGRTFAPVLVSPDRGLLVDPQDCMRRWLSGPDENASVLLFNMIAAGDVPAAKPNSYHPFG